MADRRAFLGAALFAAATAGCSSAGAWVGVGQTVRVAVSWSDKELEAFRSVLAALHLSGSGYRVQLIPFGDEIAAAFRTTPRPDVVMLPQPGLVKDYRNEIEPLPTDVVGQHPPYAEIWKDLLVHPDERNNPRWYGLPFKIANKSSVWYRRSVFAEHGLKRPESWREWLRINQTLRNAGSTPLALPGADGWMLTDFFENVLLGWAPDTYTRLARSGGGARLSRESAVRQTLGLLGRMWAPQETLAGGVKRSLVQQFSDAVVEVFGYHRAAMVVAPDFAEPIVRECARDDNEIGLFTFPVVDGDAVQPGPGGGRAPLVMGGDIAVLTKRPTGEGCASACNLVQRLSSPRAPLPWMDRGGFLAANLLTPPAYSSELATLAGELTAAAEAIRFDLSDQLGPLGGSEGLWQVLQDFLERVGGRGEAQVPGAVEQAVTQLRELEERER